MQGEVCLKTSRRPEGSSMGPWERSFIALALLGIVVWGFGGNWEFPSKETVGGAELARIPVPDQSSEPSGLAATGAQLFEGNGCYACHSLQGESKIGPSLNGIIGREVVFTDGSRMLVDQAYIIESILMPQARLVAGFEDAAMPEYEGLVNEEDAMALAAFIDSLK